MITEIGNMVRNGQGFVRVCSQRWLPFSVDHSSLGFTFQSCETSFIRPEKCEWSICMIQSQKMHKHFHSDSSVSALIYVERCKRQKTKWVYFWEDQQFVCFFMQLSWISGKNQEKKIISGSCFSLNFRYNFSVPNEVPKVKTLHEFSLELKFSVQ